MLSKIQILLMSDSDNVNVHISLVARKLLTLLPGNVMELQLLGDVHQLSNFFKNRLESVCDETRATLATCLMELGLKYLQFIVKFVVNPIGGKLDYCLEELSVVENDILGDVLEEKEVAKLLLRVTTRLQKHQTLEVKSKLESMLNNIAVAGIECNQSVDQFDLFVFL
ncbi:hypothetical protein RHSIM_Rhsim06G0083800 [Rhododendron simsii]|uniref:U3 small nucleolar RNA-associated protein 20 domain-containing protein n=1 Tax=Rhododendron simsii TaxID=118357 RepID=A0A834LLM8_RHOSS|nr:hypothetical protein RHSIM_Rhsim06G0083800 [Rhododendron simsii]